MLGVQEITASSPADKLPAAKPRLKRITTSKVAHLRQATKQPLITRQQLATANTDWRENVKPASNRPCQVADDKPELACKSQDPKCLRKTQASRKRESILPLTLEPEEVQHYCGNTMAGRG